MEKLLKLLNEYEKENGRNFEVKEIGMTYRNNDLMVISKRYGFIQRLVKNDKIDLSKSGIEELPAMYGYDYESVECKSDRLLMILSIQDNPIEFLCSVLK